MDRSTARFWFGSMLGVMLIAAEIAGPKRKSAGALPSSAKSTSGTHRPRRAIADNVIGWQSPQGG